MTRFSLILCAWNAEATVKPALRAIDELDPCPDEIILINDGSSDATCQLFSAFAAESNVKTLCVCLRTNQGVASARNLAIALADTEIVVIADADDESLRDRIALHAEAFTANPGAWISIVSQTRKYGEKLEISASEEFEYVTDDSGAYVRFLLLGETGVHPGARWAFPASSMAIRREAALALGGFDTEFRRIEDVDLCLRALIMGGSIAITSRVGVARNLERGAGTKVESNYTAERMLLRKHGYLLATMRERKVALIKIQARRNFLAGRQLRSCMWSGLALVLSPMKQTAVLAQAYNYRTGLARAMNRTSTRSAPQENLIEGPMMKHRRSQS